MEKTIRVKSLGLVRNIDVLGRLVIPKELRKELGINTGDPVEINATHEGIMIKKYEAVKKEDELVRELSSIALNTSDKETRNAITKLLNNYKEE